VSDILAVVAATWGVFMAVSPLLQIRRMIQRRSSSDLSLSYIGVLLIGFTLWMAYGISLENWALIVPNGVAFAVGVATVLVARHYRTQPELSGERLS
jgi:MtN3 and saliva related transmembrane protein